MHVPHTRWDETHLFAQLIKVCPNIVIDGLGDDIVCNAIGFTTVCDPVLNFLGDQRVTINNTLHWYRNMENIFAWYVVNSSHYVDKSTHFELDCFCFEISYVIQTRTQHDDSDWSHHSL